MFALWIPADGRYAFNEYDNGGVELEVDAVQALFDGQSAGKVIAKGPDGSPVLASQE